MKRTAHPSISKAPTQRPGALTLDDFDLVDVEEIGWVASEKDGRIRLTKPSEKNGPCFLVTKRALYMDYRVSLLAEIFPGEIGVIGNFYSPEDFCASSLVTTVGEQDYDLYTANRLYQLRGGNEQPHCTSQIVSYKYKVSLEVLEDVMSSDGRHYYDLIEQVKGRSHVGVYIYPSSKLKGTALTLGPVVVEDLGA